MTFVDRAFCTVPDTAAYTLWPITYVFWPGFTSSVLPMSLPGWTYIEKK